MNGGYSAIYFVTFGGFSRSKGIAGSRRRGIGLEQGPRMRLGIPRPHASGTDSEVRAARNE